MMEWSEKDLDDREFPDDDIDDNDDCTPTILCPKCGTDLYDDVEQCPVCGTWLTTVTSPWSGRQAWWLALALLGVAALVWALLLGRP
jgi:hypothetical protein